MALLYQGFTQNANIRSFRFEHTFEISARKKTRVGVTVQADMVQLLTAHLAVQDGPALCLSVLTALLAKAGPDLPLVHAITMNEMVAFASQRATRKESTSHRKHRPPKPSPASQLTWPRT